MLLGGHLLNRCGFGWTIEMPRVVRVSFGTPPDESGKPPLFARVRGYAPHTPGHDQPQAPARKVSLALTKGSPKRVPLSGPTWAWQLAFFLTLVRRTPTSSLFFFGGGGFRGFPVLTR